MRLFLSYRRDDTIATARAMKEFLDGVRRVKGVFLDFDGIEPGSPDFVVAIKKALRKADASVILIGPGWAGKKPDGTSRLMDTDDFVRREVALALSGGRKVLPVLIDGTQMPTSASLPDDLKPLANVNAIPLRTSRFKSDMTELLNAAAGKSGRGVDYWKRPSLTLLGAVIRLVLGALVAAGLLMGALGWWDASATAKDLCGSFNCLLAEYVGGLAPEAIAQLPASDVNERYNGLSRMIIVGVILAGAGLPFIWRAMRR